MNTMLIVRTTPVDAELVSYLLFEGGALAIGEHEAGSEIELHAGFASIESAEAMRSTLGDRAIQIETAEPNWIETQRAGFSPLEVDPWRIRAPWHQRTAAEDQLIDTVIDPGAAFGHGRHPTTRLVLEMMSTLDLDSHRVLDVGTGTGVLAIAAALVGAHVQAYDTSAVAITQATANVAANSVAELVTLVDGTIIESGEVQADVALVNVTIDQHRSTSVHLQLVPVVVLSGILASQEEEALSLYPTHSAGGRMVDDDWVCLQLTRDP
jgi:ribosomal protein L11 methyltransferase